MTGPTGTSSSPDKAHPPSQPPPQVGGNSSGSGNSGEPDGRAGAGAGGGGRGSLLSPSATTRPVTRSSAAMSSGKSTRQQQQSKNAAVASPTTPSGDSKHRHSRQHQQPPTTPKGGASSTPSASRKGETSVTTPPPTAAASTSARSPGTTARSTGPGESNTTPTPTSPTNTAGGASHHHHTRHSHHHQPASSTQHQHQEPSGGGGGGGGNPHTKKRSAAAASIDTTTSPSDTDENDEPRIDRLSLATPTTANTTATATSPTSYRGSGGSGGAPDWICLCTKEPKVPRPRNAFILYRQHHQQQTVAANPGTANPEISKIIGNKWKNEPEERKDEWRRLADEEKHQHALRYPDYKYQPRRAKSGKGGSESAVQSPVSATFPSSEGGPGTCPKCGGRYISTPRTPSTPFPPSSGRFSSGGSIPTVSMSSAPSQGRSGGDPWDRRDGPPRRDPRQSIDSAMGGDYYGRHPPPPQYQYGPSAPGSTPYPHNYGPQQGGPGGPGGGGGGGYPPYPSNSERDFRERERERDRMINNRGWPPPGPPGGPPPPAYDQQPPHPFRDRLFDIREAEYEGGMTPVAGSPSEAKRRRYNPDYYDRQQHQQPLSPPPLPPMTGYSGPPPALPRQQSMDYGYPPQGPPPPPMQLQSPHPRSAMGHSSTAPPTSGPGPQPPLMGRSTPTMGPPPPPPHSRSGSVSGYHSQPPPSAPSSSSSSGGGRGSRGGRGTSHPDDFESLRLPPLQTHLPRPGQSSAGSSGPPHTALSANSPMDVDISSATPTGLSMPTGLGISYGGHDRERDRDAPPRPVSASLIDPALRLGEGVGRRASIPPPLGKPPGPPSYPTTTPTRAPPLPPVKPNLASVPSSGPSRSQAQLPPRTDSAEEKSALGPMIMSISYLQKLVHFERIINPLSTAAPYQQTTHGATRGPIIAVEGTNTRLMKQVARAVEKALERSGSYEVKKWLGPASVVEDIESPAEKDKSKKNKTPEIVVSEAGAEGEAATSRRGSGASAGDDVVMVDAPASSAARLGSSSSKAGPAAPGRDGGDGGKTASRSSSKTPTPAIPVPASAAASTSASTPAAGDTTSASVRGTQPPQQAPGSRTSSVHTQKSIHSSTSKAPPNATWIPSVWQELSQWHSISLEMVHFVTSSSSDDKNNNGNNKRKHPQPALTPVALLPAGYTLTHSNRHACATPITDAYAPIDHWRWMASLWRGAVAPDLTIYVLDQQAMDEFVGIEDDFSPARSHAHAHPHAQTSPSSVISASNDGGRQGEQTVDFKRPGELRGMVMVVRLAGERVTGAELLDKTERRVGFEVNEWVNEWCDARRR